jgi:hypothetical protein
MSFLYTGGVQQMIPTTKFLQADGADTDAYHTQSFNENKI